MVINRSWRNPGACDSTDKTAVKALLCTQKKIQRPDKKYTVCCRTWCAHLAFSTWKYKNPSIWRWSMGIASTWIGFDWLGSADHCGLIYYKLGQHESRKGHGPTWSQKQGKDFRSVISHERIEMTGVLREKKQNINILGFRYIINLLYARNNEIQGAI